MVSRTNKRNYSHHGIEIKFDKVIIDDIQDPLARINYFKTNLDILDNQYYWNDGNQIKNITDMIN